MSRTVTREEALKNFDALLDSLAETPETHIVDDKGEIIAIVSAPPRSKQASDRARYWATVAGVDELTDEEIEEREAARQRFWATVDRIREQNADKDPDEEYRFITEVVEEVRRERREAEQRELAHSSS